VYNLRLLYTGITGLNPAQSTGVVCIIQGLADSRSVACADYFYKASVTSAHQGSREWCKKIQVYSL